MHNSDAQKGLWFSFEIDGEEYVAFISTEALRCHFQAAGANKRHLVHAYRNHQNRIHAVAQERFHHRAPRPIKLDVGDFGSEGFIPAASRQTVATVVT